jgi:HEPN domain-containing protein
VTNEDLARGYFREAEGRLRHLDALLADRRFATVVREAQEVVELLLKAALRFVGIEPARTHEVSGILRQNALRFPGWFGAQLEELARISTALAQDRGPSFYGDEVRGIPPDQLFHREDAERALEWARFVFGCCQRLLGGMK